MDVFCAMATQWREGTMGMDYGPLGLVYDMLEIPADKRPYVFRDIRVMEQAAIKALREIHERAMEKMRAENRR